MSGEEIDPITRMWTSQIDTLKARIAELEIKVEVAERVSSACDHNIMAVRAELLESKKTASALQNRLAATDRNNADLRAKLAEAERERDAVTVALTHVVMAHGVRFDRGTGDSEECSCEACKEAKRVLGPAAVAKLKGGA